MKKSMFVLMLGLLLIGANIYAEGDLQVNGALGLGVSPDAGAKLNIQSTDISGFVVRSSVTDPSLTALGGANILVSVEGTSSDGNYGGFGSRVAHNGENDTILRMIGGDNMMQLNSIYSGSTSIIDGSAMRARISSSNSVARDYLFPSGLSVLQVAYAFNDTSGGGTITAAQLKGIDIAAPSGNVLTVSSVTGLWIDQQVSGSANNYGIVLDGDGAGSDIVFGASQGSRIYSSGGVLYASDNSFNTTQISPHDPETGEWIYYSKNTKTGKVVRIEMEKLVKAIEKLTGETFMIESIEEIK